MPTCRPRRGSHPCLAGADRPDGEPAGAIDAGGGPAGLRRDRHGRRPRSGGRLPPPRPRVPRRARRASRPRPAPGDGRDRGLPHRGARRACPPLRRLRPCRHRLQLLPQPSLPIVRAARLRRDVPGPGSRGVDHGTPGGAAARPLLPRGLHPAGAGRRHGIPEQGGGLRHPVPRRGRDGSRVIAADPRHLGAEIGGVAVLHSWGQASRRRRACGAMQHHPHVHCIVPGGGLSADRKRWIACRPGFFLPVKVLGRLFRRLFLDRLAAAFAEGGLRFFGDLAPLAEPRSFTAHCAALRRSDWVVIAPEARLRRDAGGASSTRRRRRVFDATPSRPSAARSRCWPISAATPIGSPSRTVGSSP